MPEPSETPTALIIGASRGLGLALARTYLSQGWQVVATVRGTAHTGLHDLAATSDGRLSIAELDTTSAAQRDALRARLADRRFALLFVNAGANVDRSKTVADIPTEDFAQLMVTNALSPLRVIETLQDLVTPTGTIAAMSSGLGSVADNNRGGWEIYRASKAALNQLMRCYAARHAQDRRTLVLVAPGWSRTEMGGQDAPLEVDTSITGVVDMLARQAGTPGLRYLDYQGKTVPW